MVEPTLEAKRLVTPAAIFSPFQQAVVTGPFPVTSGAVRHANVSFEQQAGWTYTREEDGVSFFANGLSETPATFEQVAERVFLSTPVEDSVPLGVGYEAPSTQDGPDGILYRAVCNSCVQYVNTSDDTLQNIVFGDTPETYQLASSVTSTYTTGFSEPVGSNLVVVCYDNTCGVTNVAAKSTLTNVPATQLVNQSETMSGCGYTYRAKDYFYGSAATSVYFNNLTDNNVTMFNGSTVPSSVTFNDRVLSLQGATISVMVGFETTANVGTLAYTMVPQTFETPGTLNGTTPETAVAYYLNSTQQLCVVTASGFYEMQGLDQSPARPLWNPIARLEGQTTGWRSVVEVDPGKRWAVGTDTGVAVALFSAQRSDIQVVRTLDLGDFGLVLNSGLAFAGNTDVVTYSANKFTNRAIETVTPLVIAPQLLAPSTVMVESFPARAFQHVSLQTYGFSPYLVSVGGGATGPRVSGYDLKVDDNVGVTYTRTDAVATDPAARIIVPQPVRALLSVTLGACGTGSNATAITHGGFAFDGSKHLLYASSEGVYKYNMTSAVEELILAGDTITRVWPLQNNDFWYLQQGQLKLYAQGISSDLNVAVGAAPTLIIITIEDAYLLNTDNGTLWRISNNPLGAVQVGTPVNAVTTPLVRASNRSTVCFLDASFSTLYTVENRQLVSRATSGMTPTRALSSASVPTTGDGGLGLVAFTDDTMVFLREADAVWVSLATGAPAGFTSSHAAGADLWVLQGPAGLQTAIPSDGVLEVHETEFGTFCAQNSLGNDLFLWTPNSVGIYGSRAAVTVDFQMVHPTEAPATGTSTADKVALGVGIALIVAAVVGVILAIVWNRKRLFGRKAP